MIQGGGFTPSFAREADARADPLESEERPEERRRHARDGAHERPELGHRAVLHQRGRQRRLDYPNPDGNGYAVFGKVVAGMDVVDKIEGTPDHQARPMQDVPLKPVVIQSATVVSK